MLLPFFITFIGLVAILITHIEFYKTTLPFYMYEKIALLCLCVFSYLVTSFLRGSSGFMRQVSWWLSFLFQMSLTGSIDPIPILSFGDHWRLSISSKITKLLLNLCWVYVSMLTLNFPWVAFDSFSSSCFCNSSLTIYDSFQDLSSTHWFSSNSSIFLIA